MPIQDRPVNGIKKSETHKIENGDPPSLVKDTEESSTEVLDVFLLLTQKEASTHFVEEQKKV